MKQDRIEFEKKTVEKLIKIYCKHNHNSINLLCSECNKLLNYSFNRLDNCKFGIKKSVCANCKIHCYKQDMRKRIIEIMRYSAPKMIFAHPILTAKYLIYKFSKDNYEK